ncbi:hypothetical protein MYCTH_2306863 [Thermothelomyces thermophilus ATCC 42464]|uniref:Uncharacterized protein n=1 Tax=Thermothelomyces thermophilus (strain ATCC 42464 / BCRC 31852 / DSM 1799) TaxID=573729 RepID=G2QEX6_THET4|nr:uncharacterized protein MYCTH_2306863 [Thermothelomyces thermophilus ATCC 42464]AEO59005.1 hypothetical protein MYCTH_2306863 [Thermothelomyces thermophilus ATCC 42464]
MTGLMAETDFESHWWLVWAGILEFGGAGCLLCPAYRYSGRTDRAAQEAGAVSQR